MFFKTKKSSIFTKSYTFSREIRNNNGCKTKKCFISFEFDLILVMKSNNFNFYNFSLTSSKGKATLGLNYWRWKGGRAERFGTEAKQVKCNAANKFCDALAVGTHYGCGCLPSLMEPNININHTKKQDNH